MDIVGKIIKEVKMISLTINTKTWTKRYLFSLHISYLLHYSGEPDLFYVNKKESIIKICFPFLPGGSLFLDKKKQTFMMKEIFPQTPILMT